MSIEARQVMKRFGAVTALAGACLRVAPGERVALVGPNGSGKSTLLRCLLGLIRHEGEVTIDGLSVAERPEEALRHVAYVPQIAPPIDATVGQVTRAWADLRRLDRACLVPIAADFGLVLERVEAVRLRDLSGGMKQKLLVAMALASRPKILFCDEPTANLDAGARAVFFGAVAALPADTSLVLCSHRLEEVRHLVTRVVELDEGRVVADRALASFFEGLRVFHVDITLASEAHEARAFLEARGFEAISSGRYAATLTQAEKLALIHDLVRGHAASLRDLSLTCVDELAYDARRKAG